MRLGPLVASCGWLARVDAVKAQFTLHESWNELKRYTNLRPEKVREIPQAASNADHLGEAVKLPVSTGPNLPSVAADQLAPQDPSR